MIFAHRVIWLVMFGTLPLNLVAEETLDARLQRILDQEIARHSTHGVSAAAVFPDGRVWKGAGGISHDTVPIRPDMLFALGSVTKNVVAALTLRLAEQGDLALENPISKTLPDFPHVDNRITIRQLLNHTSGIYMFWESKELWDELERDKARVWKPEEVLATIGEPDFKPGEGWRYSNTNYLLLAMIIEKVTGSELSAEFRKQFWEPLGMPGAYLMLQEAPPPERLAHVYGDGGIFGGRDEDVTFVPRSAHESIAFGSAGLFMTAEDLARWAFELFEGRVLEPESMNQMLQFVKFRPVANMSAYGLGVQKYDRRFTLGKTGIGHGGGNIGTTTYMLYLPDQHVSLDVMINAFPDGAADVITKKLLKAILKDQKALGLIPYVPFFPTGVLLTSLSIMLTTLVFSLIKRKAAAS